MAKKLTGQQFTGEISALAESIRAEVQAANPKAALPFGDWCREVSPAMRWDWTHLAYIRAKVQPRIDALAECLEASLAGREVKPTGTGPRHLILSVPPRHGKSEQVTIRLPPYLLERWPKMKVILGAYNQSLVNKFAKRCRRIATGRVNFAPDSQAINDWETVEGGGIRAVGTGAGVTGTGGHLIIIDDPVKSREEAESETYREKVWDWFCDDLYTRLEPGGVIILIMTRWHDDDLAGRIQKSDFAHDFEVVNLPAEAEFDDPLGREPGQPLCPNRFSVEALKKLRTVLGRSYNSLYQGRPTAVDGDIIQLAWFKRYTAKPPFVRIVQSWDTASKDGIGNDYSVCETWAETVAGDSFLIDVLRERLQYPGLKRAAILQRQRHNPDIILIEDKGHGTGLGQELRLMPGYNIVMVEPEGDKLTRMSVESAALEGGRVWIPEPPPAGPSCPWLPDFEQECQHFPKVKHDDQVDSMSQYLRWKRERSLSLPLVPFTVSFN